MLVHIYTGQNIFFIRIKEAFHTVVARRDYMYRLTRPIALANATTCVAQRDLSCDKT